MKSAFKGGLRQEGRNKQNGTGDINFCAWAGSWFYARFNAVLIQFLNCHTRCIELISGRGDRGNAVCRSRPKLHQLGILCHLLSHTGLRLGEATSLTWSDIDFKQGFLTVRDERFSSQGSGYRRRVKDGSPRRVPLTKSLKEPLWDACPRQTLGWIFATKSGQRLMPNNLREKFISQVIKPLAVQFRDAKGVTGIKAGRFHSFRHYFVSQCFLKGVSEGTIRSWLGHSDSKILEMYRHLAAADSKRLMEKLEFTGEAEET